MEWRNSIPSPQSYRYFIIVFDSVEELEDFELPGWFDTNKMGYIAIYDGVIYGIDGPDTTDWLPEIGYPAADIELHDNLYVYYPYQGTGTYLAFVRFAPADIDYQGNHYYAWIIGDQRWSTLYTNTIDCTAETVLYRLNGEVLEQSDATLHSEVWTNKVTILVEQTAGLINNTITMSDGTSSWTNSYPTFTGGVTNRENTLTVTVTTGAPWKWDDTGESTPNPRTFPVSKYGTYILIS